jgi:hypothetical protein
MGEVIVLEKERAFRARVSARELKSAHADKLTPLLGAERKEGDVSFTVRVKKVRSERLTPYKVTVFRITGDASKETLRRKQVARCGVPDPEGVILIREHYEACTCGRGFVSLLNLTDDPDSVFFENSRPSAIK